MEEQNKYQTNEQESERKKRRAVIIAVIILLLIVGVTIGYAGLSTNLKINGTTKIDKTQWAVCFDSTNVRVKSGSIRAIKEASVVGDSAQVCSTEITYEIRFTEPGQYYEFEVDAKNTGTINAKLSNTNKTALTEDQQKYIKYTVTYADGSTIATNDTLNVNQTRTYKVRVEFDPDTSDGTLNVPATDLTLSFSATYVQA